MGGHLFIINGDLTKVACDAILIPTDDGFSINTPWRRFLNAHHADELAELKECPAEAWRSSSVIPLECVDKKPRVWLGNVGQVGDESEFETFKPVVEEFVRTTTNTADDGKAQRIYGWPKHRLAVNLVGSGHGGGSQKKGHLVYGLVETLRDLASVHDVDIILVTFGAKPFAAAQSARRQLIGESDEALRATWFFEGQPHKVDLVESARLLAKEAVDSQLVLFIGAGVSVGAGLPLWRGLLSQVASEANIASKAAKRLTKKDPRDQATILERRLESQKTQLRTAVANQLEASSYALAHGSLASLPSKEAVTTNFDRLFEMAWTTGRRHLAILPERAVGGSGRWLLKLHGTVNEPCKMVLTRSDYLDMPRQYGALMGLVQGLLMMRHMMFVGYSLQDEDFHELIHEVRAAQGHKKAPKVRGTVLTLHEDALEKELWINDLHILAMTAATPKMADEDAARQLDIFLDLVCYLSTTSAAFFLDKTYDKLLSDKDKQLRNTLSKLVRDTKNAEAGDVGYKVRQFLRDELGAHAPPENTTKASESHRTVSTQQKSAGEPAEFFF